MISGWNRWRLYNFDCVMDKILADWELTCQCPIKEQGATVAIPLLFTLSYSLILDSILRDNSLYLCTLHFASQCTEIRNPWRKCEGAPTRPLVSAATPHAAELLVAMLLAVQQLRETGLRSLTCCPLSGIKNKYMNIMSYFVYQLLVILLLCTSVGQVHHRLI